MNRTFLLFISILLVFTDTAFCLQSDNIPAEIRPLIESGTQPLSLKSVDLNGDGLQDFVLVLEFVKTETDTQIIKDGQRVLLLLIREPGGTIKEVKRNSMIISCSTCGGVSGDPFQGIETGIKTFTVNHYGGSSWRWSSSYQFDYSRRDKTWQLVRVEETNFNTREPEKITRKEYTPPEHFGKIDIADFDPDNWKGQGAKEVSLVEKYLSVVPETEKKVFIGSSKSPLVVAAYNDKGFIRLSVLDENGIVKTLDNKFDQETSLFDFSGRTAKGEIVIQFFAKDEKYAATYYWLLKTNTLYYKTVRLSDQRAFFSKNLGNNSEVSAIVKDPQAEAKYEEAATFFKMFDFLFSIGYVPALDENLDPDLIVQNDYSIKEFDDKTLSLNTFSCWGASVLCKEKDLYNTWDGTKWVSGLTKNKIEDPPSTDESIDLNGDNIEEKIALVEDCFRDSCQYAWSLYTLSSDGSKYDEAIRWEGGGTFEGCDPNTRVKYSVDNSTKPFPTLVFEESTQIKVKTEPNSNYCEPEGWNKKIIRYQWDEKLSRFNEQP